MRATIPSLIATAFLSFGCASGKGPLSFQLPTDWILQHDRAAGGLHFYRATGPARTPGLLELMQGSPEGKGEHATKGPGKEYPAEQFESEDFRGSYSVFDTSTNGLDRVVVVIGMRSGRMEWTGRFAGSPEGWANALKILKTTKRNG